MVFLLELIAWSPGPTAVDEGRLLLWKTAADGARKTWYKLFLRTV